MVRIRLGLMFVLHAFLCSPSLATRVGFYDWKSEAWLGDERASTQELSVLQRLGEASVSDPRLEVDQRDFVSDSGLSGSPADRAANSSTRGSAVIVRDAGRFLNGSVSVLSQSFVGSGADEEPVDNAGASNSLGFVHRFEILEATGFGFNVDLSSSSRRRFPSLLKAEISASLFSIDADDGSKALIADQFIDWIDGIDEPAVFVNLEPGLYSIQMFTEIEAEAVNPDPGVFYEYNYRSNLFYGIVPAPATAFAPLAAAACIRRRRPRGRPATL